MAKHNILRTSSATLSKESKKKNKTLPKPTECPTGRHKIWRKNVFTATVVKLHPGLVVKYTLLVMC